MDSVLLILSVVSFIALVIIAIDFAIEMIQLLIAKIFHTNRWDFFVMKQWEWTIGSEDIYNIYDVHLL